MQGEVKQFGWQRNQWRWERLLSQLDWTLPLSSPFSAWISEPLPSISSPLIWPNPRTRSPSTFLNLHFSPWLCKRIGTSQWRWWCEGQGIVQKSKDWDLIGNPNGRESTQQWNPNDGYFKRELEKVKLKNLFLIPDVSRVLPQVGHAEFESLYL